MGKSLDAVLVEINKKFGSNTAQVASEAKGLDYIRIPTGIFALDLAVGGGYGLPRGRVSLIVGEKSSGKTTVCKKTMATWQKYCRFCNSEIYVNDNGKKTCTCKKAVPMKVVYIDGEGTYDPVWARALGVNNEEVIMVQPDYAEQAVDVAEALIRTGEVDLLIVDSIAGLVPSIEVEGSADDQNVGVHARLMNRFMRAIQSGINSLGMNYEHKPHVILVNQYREKVGVMFGNNLTLPGGKGQEFTASIKIEMRSSSKIGENGAINPKQESNYNKQIEIVGAEMNFEVTKNKTYPPFKRGSFRVFSQDVCNSSLDVMKGQVNTEEQLLAKAVQYGIIKANGSWYSYKDTKLGQGLVKTAQNLMENEAMYEEIHDMTLARVAELNEA